MNKLYMIHLRGLMYQLDIQEIEQQIMVLRIF